MQFLFQDKYPVRTNFLEGQEITGKMRSILIDWLCQVHHRFHLLQETLYLTVAIIDRFLQVIINLFPLQPLTGKTGRPEAKCPTVIIHISLTHSYRRYLGNEY